VSQEEDRIDVGDWSAAGGFTYRLVRLLEMMF
jgi:hypothetical protein